MCFPVAASGLVPAASPAAGGQLYTAMILSALFTTPPSPRTLLMIWEVLARTHASPARAVCLLSRQGVTITQAEAARQLAAAPERNTLRLVRL